MTSKFSGDNRIVVDWDGTCVENVWPDHGDWLPGAREALRSFVDAGLDVVIYSTRLAPVSIDEETIIPPLTILREHMIVRNKLNSAFLWDVVVWDKPWKPGALYYIDDKAIHYDNNWKEIVDIVTGTRLNQPA